jgi:hypothetical protein
MFAGNRAYNATVVGATDRPEGKFTFRRLPDAGSLISVDELITKMIAAYGGEENLRKHKTSIATIEIDMQHQGVMAEGQVSAWRYRYASEGDEVRRRDTRHSVS